MPSLPKPHSKTRRERKRARYREERPEVRKAVWDRQQGRCGWPTCRTWIFLSEMHAHEVVFRSALGSPIDDNNVIGLCWQCHGDCHVKVGGKLKRIEWQPIGQLGKFLRFFERINGKAPWVEVTR